MERDDITAEDFTRALEAAHRAQRAQPRATRFYWAEQAVREVFGDRLGIIENAIPPQSMPLYYRLVSRVEAALWQEAKSSAPASVRQGEPQGPQA